MGLTSSKVHIEAELCNAAVDGQLDKVKNNFFTLENMGGDINPAMRSGKTVLHLAAQHGHLNVVSFYTSRLQDPNPGSLSRGRTPLHVAAQYGHLPVVRHIAARLADKNPKDSEGYTPLHSAAYNGHLEVVKYIVQYAADIHLELAVHQRQKSPLDLARERGHTEIVSFLVKQNEQLKAKSSQKCLTSPRLETGAVSNTPPPPTVPHQDCTVCFEPEVKHTLSYHAGMYHFVNNVPSIFLKMGTKGVQLARARSKGQ